MMLDPDSLPSAISPQSSVLRFSILHRLEKHWQRTTPVTLALLPLSWVYCALTGLRRLSYRLGLKRVHRLPVPVVVVGNITPGGTGKTPLVCWLASLLSKAGYRPGIVSRGYGGRAHVWPRAVSADSDPLEVGDEPVLMARTTGCPVVAGPDRVAAARMLLRDHPVTLIIADDGLQHLALGRDIEIAVIDGMRRFGNGRCLPAGPLREGPGRLTTVHAVVYHGDDPREGELAMRLEGKTFHRVADPSVAAGAESFRHEPVHGTAGIGNPQRFFAQLRALGLEVIEHVYPDHHRYTGAEIRFPDSKMVIMTEKDAVKCTRIAEQRHWYLPVTANPDPRLGERVLKLLGDMKNG